MGPNPGGTMRAIWKGSISFGLVSIPVSLYPATRREELRFRLLRASDLSPVNYKRVAEADGREVPWAQIVKGYEYEKGKFVVVKDEDFARVDVEATQTVDIINFVESDQVDPLLFHKPYYMEAAGKGADKAYVLLRDALAGSGKIAICKVVIKTRQHLAAIKPQKKELMLELMHYPAEILDASEFRSPALKAVAAAEMKMAKKLIDSMSTAWDPDAYHDESREALKKIVEDKIEHGGKNAPHPAKRGKRPSNIIDLVSVLQKSINENQGGRGQHSKGRAKAAKKKAAKSAHRRAA